MDYLKYYKEISNQIETAKNEEQLSHLEQSLNEINRAYLHKLDVAPTIYLPPNKFSKFVYATLIIGGIINIAKAVDVIYPFVHNFINKYF